MLQSIDLVGFVQVLNKCEGTELIGKVTNILKRPGNLFQNVSCNGGDFVSLDVLAAGFSKDEAYLRMNGVCDSYVAVNGQVCVYLDGCSVGDFVRVRGTLRCGTKQKSNYLTMFKFGKRGEAWTIEPYHADVLKSGDLGAGTPLSEAFEDAVKSGVIARGAQLLSLRRCSATLPYTVPVEKYEEVADATRPVAAKPFAKESRDKVSVDTKRYDELEKVLYGAEAKLAAFKKQLREGYALDLDKPEACIADLAGKVLSTMHNKPTGKCMTGRTLLKKYLGNFEGSGEAERLMLIDDFEEVIGYMLRGEKVNLPMRYMQLCRVAFGSPEKFYAGMISAITGVSLSDVCDLCLKEGISLSKLLNSDPYAIQVISNLSFQDVDIVAQCMGKAQGGLRSVAMLNAYVMDSGVNDTMCVLADNKAHGVGVSITKLKYEKCTTMGTFVSDTVRENCLHYLNTVFNYPWSDFKKDTHGTYSAYLYGKELWSALDKYIEVGLGVTFSGYVTSVSLLRKELVIFDFFLKMAKQESGLKDADIDVCIDEYEGIVGFKLEPEQRKSVHLLMHNSGCVAGSAGSGKTTVSACFVYCIGKLCPDWDVKFAAPTGKAAKRLQEVVKKPVKTMHSLFRVWTADESLFTEERNEAGLGQQYYIFDEMAMVTVDLLYKVVKRLDSSSRVYMFGDVHQLSPIGKGMPFLNLLKFMPCQYLAVSKRAASGSEITMNADLINNHSSEDDWAMLRSGGDFELVPCGEEVLKHKVAEIVSGLIKQGYGSDDIQVATPVSTAKYDWGAIQLNKVLQPMFNKATGFSKTFAVKSFDDYQKYLIGDKVIHNSNMYSMQWYTTEDYETFQKVYGFGVCNGDVGRIVAIVNATNVKIEDEVGSVPAGFSYPDNMREDETWVGKDNAYFVVVEYYDYMQDMPFNILYRCQRQMNSQLNFGYELYGEDLSKINLFYAGTVHKLQGSQYPIVVCPVGLVRASGFLSRNMLYTEFTRGIKKVYAVGNVGQDRNSAISIARGIVAGANVLTIGDYLCGKEG